MQEQPKARNIYKKNTWTKNYIMNLQEE